MLGRVLDLRELTAGYGPVARAARTSRFTAPRGRDHRRARRQRRRQDHAAAHHLRAGPAPHAARSTFDGRELDRLPRRADARPRPRARARGPRRDHRADRRGEPPARRPRPRRPGAAPTTSSASTTCSRRSPSAAPRSRTSCPAASGRCSCIGRALMAAPDACCCSTSRRSGWRRGSSRRSSTCCATLVARRGPHRAARRAERPQRPVHRRPRRRAQPRPGRRRRRAPTCWPATTSSDTPTSGSDRRGDRVQQLVNTALGGLTLGHGLRRVRAGPGADLALDPDRQLRPGADGDGHHVHRAGADRRRPLLLARLRRRPALRAWCSAPSSSGW